MKQRCCFCAYEAPARALQAHISKAHPRLRRPKAFGRSKGNSCLQCGFVHDEIARPGWAIRRKKFERGKVVTVVGGVAPNVGLQTLGRFTVPRGVSKIIRIEFHSSPCRGPFIGPEAEDGRRFCLTCNCPHFDARKATPGNCRFMMIHDGRMIQCSLQPGHRGAHEVPPTWREWWETGNIGRREPRLRKNVKVG